MEQEVNVIPDCERILNSGKCFWQHLGDFKIIFFFFFFFQVLGFLLLWEGIELYLHWCHKVGHLNLHRSPETRTECASLALCQIQSFPLFCCSPYKKKSTYTILVEIVKLVRKVTDVLKELNLNFIFPPYYGRCDSVLFIPIKS